MKKLQRSFHLLFLTLLIFGSAITSSYSQDNIFLVLLKRQEEKRKSGWTLMEWLKLKEKISMQNMWLALNSSFDAFEFILDYSQQNFDSENIPSLLDENSQEIEGDYYSASLFFSIIGVQSLMEKNQFNLENKMNMIKFRPFGRYEQGTNITFEYGLREFTFNPLETVKSSFWGGSASIYLSKFLGVDGVYRIFDKDESNLNTPIDGFYREGGGFIELSLLRLYAHWFKEKQYFHNAASDDIEQTVIREGIKLGLKLFF